MIVRFGKGVMIYRPVKFSDGPRGIEIRQRRSGNHGSGAVMDISKESEARWDDCDSIVTITFENQSGVDLFIDALNDCKRLP